MTTISRMTNNPELPDHGVAVTVFDHMARRGYPQKWLPNGDILARRATEDGAL